MLLFVLFTYDRAILAHVANMLRRAFQCGALKSYTFLCLPHWPWLPWRFAKAIRNRLFPPLHQPDFPKFLLERTVPRISTPLTKSRRSFTGLISAETKQETKPAQVVLGNFSRWSKRGSGAFPRLSIRISRKALSVLQLLYMAAPPGYTHPGPTVTRG